MGARGLLTVLLLCAAGPAREESVVERRFSSELELHTETFEFSASGGGRTSERQGPRVVREQAQEIEVRDSLFDDERPPAKFTRFYRSATNSLRFGSESAPQERTGSAGLEGKSVTFEREDDGSYARSSEDADARPVQLRRLRADLSLAGFLPPEEVEDEHWEIPAAEILRLVSPLEERSRSGTRALRNEAPAGNLDVAPAILKEPMVRLMGELEGTLKAVGRASAEDDELPRNATLEFRLSGAFDGSAPMVGGAEGEDELTLVYEGTGTLAWDPRDGRITVSCSGELRMSEAFRVQLEVDGKSAEARGKLEVSGTLELEGREEPGE